MKKLSKFILIAFFLCSNYKGPNLCEKILHPNINKIHTKRNTESNFKLKKWFLFKQSKNLVKTNNANTKDTSTDNINITNIIYFAVFGVITTLSLFLIVFGGLICNRCGREYTEMPRSNSVHCLTEFCSGDIVESKREGIVEANSQNRQEILDNHMGVVEVEQNYSQDNHAESYLNSEAKDSNLGDKINTKEELQNASNNEKPIEDSLDSNIKLNSTSITELNNKMTWDEFSEKCEDDCEVMLSFDLDKLTITYVSGFGDRFYETHQLSEIIDENLTCSPPLLFILKTIKDDLLTVKKLKNFNYEMQSFGIENTIRKFTLLKTEIKHIENEFNGHIKDIGKKLTQIRGDFDKITLNMLLSGEAILSDDKGSIILLDSNEKSIEDIKKIFHEAINLKNCLLVKIQDILGQNFNISIIEPPNLSAINIDEINIPNEIVNIEIFSKFIAGNYRTMLEEKTLLASKNISAYNELLPSVAANGGIRSIYIAVFLNFLKEKNIFIRKLTFSFESLIITFNEDEVQEVLECGFQDKFEIKTPKFNKKIINAMFGGLKLNENSEILDLVSATHLSISLLMDAIDLYFFNCYI